VTVILLFHHWLGWARTAPPEIRAGPLKRARRVDVESVALALKLVPAVGQVCVPGERGVTQSGTLETFLRGPRSSIFGPKYRLPMG
jgi:hypothetical protein